MAKVRCPWSDCQWNIDHTCDQNIIVLQDLKDLPNALVCCQYEPLSRTEKKGGNDKD